MILALYTGKACTNSPLRDLEKKMEFSLDLNQVLYYKLKIHELVAETFR